MQASKIDGTRPAKCEVMRRGNVASGDKTEPSCRRGGKPLKKGKPVKRLFPGRLCRAWSHCQMYVLTPALSTSSTVASITTFIGVWHLQRPKAASVHS